MVLNAFSSHQETGESDCISLCVYSELVLTTKGFCYRVELPELCMYIFQIIKLHMSNILN